MTQAEQASLDRLADKMDAGFAEMRALMETRRIEEVRVQEQYDKRIRVVERIGYVASVLGTIGLAFSVALLGYFTRS